MLISACEHRSPTQVLLCLQGAANQTKAGLKGEEFKLFDSYSGWTEGFHQGPIEDKQGE